MRPGMRAGRPFAPFEIHSRAPASGRRRLPTEGNSLPAERFCLSLTRLKPQQPVFTVEPPGAPPPRRRAGGAGGIVGGLVAMLVLFSKFGWTFLSMFFMIFVYAQIFGWKLAAGVVVLIFVHEM